MEPSAKPVTQTAPTNVTPPPESDLQIAHFALDSSRLSKDARKALKADAAWLKKNPSGKVEVQGHCDERGSSKYNMKLGEKRARATKRYLVKLGVKAPRLKVVSYGFDKPLNPGHNEEAWAQNRRAAFVMLTP